MTDYTAAVKQKGIGYTSRLCQEATVDMLEDLFDGKKYNSPSGEKKELKFYRQDLPIPEDNDEDVDTSAAPAPYLIVAVNDGIIKDDKTPQVISLTIVICGYDSGHERVGWQDVMNIESRIVNKLCAAPYYGGCFTVEKPITWALQTDDTYPYYYGAINISVTTPAMTQDTEMEKYL